MQIVQALRTTGGTHKRLRVGEGVASRSRLPQRRRVAHLRLDAVGERVTNQFRARV